MVPGPWIQPRLDRSTSAVATATRRPCSRASASVSPTEPISGSVNVTRLTRAVVGPDVLGAEQVRDRDVRLVARDVGEGAAAGDVADRPEPLAGPRAVVDVDGVGLGVEPDGLEPDVGEVVGAAGHDEQLVHDQVVAVDGQR